MQPRDTSIAGAVPALDHDFLRDNYLTPGFGRILKDALRVYCEQNRILTGQLRTALDREEIGETIRLAHAIKGSSGSVGAQAMELLAGKLEEAGEEAGTAAITALVEALEAELLRTEKAIDEALTRLT